MFKEPVVLKKQTQANSKKTSLILLKKKALKPDLKTLVLFLKKFIKKNEDTPKHSQQSSKKIKLFANTKNNMLIIKKFICVKKRSFCKKSNI